MFQKHLFLFSFAFITLVTSAVTPDPLEDHQTFFETVMSLPAEIQEHCFSWLPTKDILCLTRTCKSFLGPAVGALQARAHKAIVELLPLWFTFPRDSVERENLRTILELVLDGLKTGEPEDFMVEAIRKELFEELSEGFLVASGRFPKIVSEIIKHRRTDPGFKITPEPQHIHHLDLALLNGLRNGAEAGKLLCDYLALPNFDVTKLCDFLDRHHPSYAQQHMKQRQTMAIMEIFTGLKSIPPSRIDETVISMAILMLRLNQEEKRRVLQILTGSEFTLADNGDLEDNILDYLGESRHLDHIVFQFIPACVNSGIPESFLEKFVQKFKVPTSPSLVLALKLSKYPSSLYETISGTSKDQIELLLRLRPSALTEVQIEAAIMLLPDLERLYEAIAILKENAEFTSFHLLLVLASKNCCQYLKREFAQLPFKNVSLSGIPDSSNHELGPDFVDPLLRAITSNPTEELLQFCCFPELKFGQLFLVKQYKLFALKLHAMLLLGRDEAVIKVCPLALNLLMRHLLGQYTTEQLQSFLKTFNAKPDLWKGKGLIVTFIEQHLLHHEYNNF